jgi:DNA polymerase III subunit gamma/tau
MAGSDPANVAAFADSRYRVLARKYRPATFESLIGQEALVRTLSNAFRVGRIAHAYMLSGVRGVGKTTTARIIARALNCTGADGTGGVTISPCGVCEHCVAIAEDRHLDVIEMDAASHTGVDNIRELLDGVPYRPALARYKVYIIDEVHMLSEKAFNALLKTLEEPPEHVKFIFATTEIRKVPVTVLSRCQRFDLRRVGAAELARHLASVAGREQVTVAPAALQLLARAADGSVRDALSLLDQAIAHGEGAVEEETVREMLGLVDRSLCFDVLDAVMQGDARTALAVLEDQYRAGADPLTVLEDLLDLTHWLTRLKLAPESGDGPQVPEADRVRGRSMAERLSMADVTRAWQMLLKGLSEARVAPSPLHAAEMLLIRLAYAAQLPSPVEALEALVGRGAARDEPTGIADRHPDDSQMGSGRTGGERYGAGSTSDRQSTSAASERPRGAPGGSRPSAAAAPHRPPYGSPAEIVAVTEGSAPPAPKSPASFTDLVELARERSEGLLYGHLTTSVHLVRFEAGDIELRLGEHAPSDLPQRLSRFLLEATGVRWLVTVSREAGEPTLREQRDAQRAAQQAEVARHPLVRAILDTFPGAIIERINEVEAQHASESPDEPED